MINCKTAVILAGGESKRMSYNKEFIKDGEEYLVHKNINKLREIFEEVIVVTNNEQLYKDKDCITLEDEEKFKGPLAGLSVALKNTKSEYIYLLAVDMPFIDNDYITEIMSYKPGYEVYAVKNKDFIEPFQAIYHKDCLKYISESKSLFKLIKSARSFIIDVDDISKDKDKIFFNINTVNDLESFNKRKLVSKVEIKRFYKDKSEVILDDVVVEYPITLYINEKKYVTMVCTPDNLEELVIGHLKTDGIIKYYGEITSITLNKNRVDIKLKKELEIKKSREKILYSACGIGTDYHEILDEITIDFISNNIEINTGEIYRLSKLLAQKSELFANTGGVHSALYKYDSDTVFREDIGRHNAVDKLIGYILINKLTTNGVIVVSGRLSSDMLLKIIFMKIPIVISRSAPTSLSITLADKFGITLIGFARSNKMNVYTHKYRVVN